MRAKRKLTTRKGKRQADSLVVATRLTMQIAAIVDLVDEVQMLAGELYWLVRRTKRSTEKSHPPAGRPRLSRS